MAFYMSESVYTPEFWAQLIENPDDRRDAARAIAEDAGCKMHGFWYAFDRTGFVLFEGDHVSIMALKAALLATGIMARLEFYPLITVDEMVDEVLPKARELSKSHPDYGELNRHDS